MERFGDAPALGTHVAHMRGGDFYSSEKCLAARGQDHRRQVHGAQKAGEYASHDKTFEIPVDGIARIVEIGGEVLIEQQVEKSDIWRRGQTKDEPVRDWVKLAVDRARQSGIPAAFWLDRYRPHDAELIKTLEQALQRFGTALRHTQLFHPIVTTGIGKGLLHFRVVAGPEPDD